MIYQLYRLKVQALIGPFILASINQAVSLELIEFKVLDFISGILAMKLKLLNFLIFSYSNKIKLIERINFVH